MCQSFDLEEINVRHDHYHFRFEFVFWQNLIKRAIKNQKRRHFIIKMCIICEKNIIQRASIMNSSISSEIVINSTKNETIKTTNASEETTTTTKDSIRKSMTKKKSTKFTLLSILRSWQSWALCFVKSRIEFWTRFVFNITYEINRRSFFIRRFRNSFLSTI